MKNTRNILLAATLFLGACSGGDSTAPGSGTGKAGSQARFAIAGDYLYTVNDNSLTLFNIETVDKPIQETSSYIGFGIETIFPFRDKLLIGSQDGMYVYSIAQPDNPQRLSTFFHARSCDPVVADSNYAYITLRSGTACTRGVNQLDVVNIKDINYPTLVRSLQLNNPYGLGLEDSTLFVCDGFKGIKVYNVAHPVDSLQLLTSITGLETYDVILNHGIALVVGKDGFHQYDYTNLANIKKLSFLPVVY